MQMKLKNVKLAFPSIFAHAEYQGESRGQYEAQFLIAEDDAQLNQVKKAIAKVAKDEFGDAWQKAKLPISDGNEKTYDGFAGHWALKATNKNRFAIIDRDRTPLVEADDKPRAGDVVNALVSIYAFSNKYGSFLKCQLMALQFVEEGERYGGGGQTVVIEDVFDNLSGESEIPFDGDDDDTAPF